MNERAGPADDAPLLGPTVVVTSLGLMVIALCAVRGRDDDPALLTDGLYFLGLVLLFGPTAVRVLARRTSDRERLLLTVFSALAFQASRFVLFPTRFMEHDEFIHATVLHHLEGSRHLFGTNTLLPVSSYYPGLELATAAVQQLTGLSDRVAADVVLVVARLAVTLAILGVVHALTGSWRTACLAHLGYVCNPQYIGFNGQFSYQSLALPLALFTVYTLLSRRRDAGARQLALPFLAMIATIFTHHLTGLLLVAGLGAWAVLEAVLPRRRDGEQARVLAGFTLVGLATALGWAGRPGNTFYDYVGSIARSSYDNAVAIVTGRQTHALFADSAGTPTPPWEQVVSVASILVLVAALVPALWRSRRKLRSYPALASLLILLAWGYPLLPGGHLAAATAEVSDRAAGFLFLGVAFVLALTVRELMHGRRRWVRFALPVTAVIVFVGGAVIGAGPVSNRVPGPYLVAADQRSVDAPNLAAARWLATHVLAGTRVYADRDAGLLASAVGHVTTVTHLATGIDASRVLLAPTYTEADADLLRRAEIALVIVDRRDATQLPHETYYVESGEYGSEHGPRRVAAGAVSKLDSVPGVLRIYDNGPIVIYDVGAVSGARAGGSG